MIGTCGVFLFVLLHVRASGEGEAGSDAAAAGVNQQFHSMMAKMVSQMKTTQELVVQRLEAEAGDALSLGSTSEVEAHKAKMDQARQLDAQLATLKASFEGKPYEYSHFKDAAEKLNGDGNEIEKNMRSIMEILPGMKAKSEEYQHKNFELSQGVKKFEHGSVPALTKELGREVKRSIHDIEGVDFRQAFTKEQEKLAEEGIKDSLSPLARLIKYGELPDGPKINGGHDPYADMSKNGYLPGLGASVDEELNQGPTVNYEPTNRQNRKSGIKSEDYGVSSLVEIHPRNFVAVSGSDAGQ